MKLLPLIQILLLTQTVIFPQTKLQTLWSILEREDTTSLAGFFQNWSDESIPISQQDFKNLQPIIKNTYEIVECLYRPFLLPMDEMTELDSIELAIPYVIFPTKITVRIMDSLFFESQHLQNWRDLIVEEQNNFTFKPQLRSSNKKILFLTDMTDAMLDTMIHPENQKYFDKKISLLSQYLILQKGYWYGLSKYKVRIASPPYPVSIDFNVTFNRATIFFKTSYMSAMEISFTKKNMCWSIDESKPKKSITY